MDDHQPQARREEYWSDPIAVNRRVVEQYRATGGHGDGFSGPSRMLLLTTSGARTGRPHWIGPAEPDHAGRARMVPAA